MNAIADWEYQEDLPNTLHEILKEVEINNSYTNPDMTSQLHASLESSYAYLRRLQYTMVPYQRFEYQTREFLMEITENSKEKDLKYYTEELARLKEEEPENIEDIEKIEASIEKFTQILCGDFYLDKYRRVCMEVPFNMVSAPCRNRFRNSIYYDKELTLEEISTNSNLFETIPMVLIDSFTAFDILIKPMEKGTRFIFNSMNPVDIYDKYGSQIFHETIVQFVPNGFYTSIELNPEKIVDNIIPHSEIPNWNIFLMECSGKEGIPFIGIETQKRTTKTTLLECTIVDDGLYVHMDERTAELLEREGYTLSIHLVFISHIHRHDFYTNKGILGTHSYDTKSSDDEYEHHIESDFFVPLNSDGNPYTMPIPSKNIIVSKRMENAYYPMFGVTVKDYYPNMYQIIDSDMTEDDNYRIYYFYYEDRDRKYTPLHDFYYDYLKNHYEKSIEEIINMVYFQEESSHMYKSGEEMNSDWYAEFYDLFRKIIEYQDYNYIYGITDFCHTYDGDDIPLQYKISRMRAFIRGDYHVLQDYVLREKQMGDLYHFFVYNTELTKRFRRSTIMETDESPFAFASGLEYVDASTEGALKVVRNTDYDIETEILINDASLLDLNVQEGDYIKLIDSEDRYVFVFQNDDLLHHLPLRVFVDGIWSADTEIVHRYGMDYLYVPARLVNEESYIMIEREYAMTKPLAVPFSPVDEHEWCEIHLVETPMIAYTMNDISVETEDHVQLNKEEYEIELVRDKVGYSMYDERHDVTNKYGIVTDIRVKLHNVTTENNGKFIILVNKTSYLSKMVMKRKGYPRFYLDGLNTAEDISFVRMYFNGRLIPRDYYKYIHVDNVHFVQSRIFARKGDTFVFEISPYARERVHVIEELPSDYIVDFTGILNKPADPRYYEFFLNGRRLGIENVFEFGPHHAVFRGTHSRNCLEIYEKERDYEYFGYDSIGLEGTHYFFTPMELITKEFITPEEVEKIITNYIESVKDDRVKIKPNDECEEDNTFEVSYTILEDAAIFYYEDLLPLGFADPNKRQFSNRFLSVVYPYLCDRYLDDEMACLFLNPDVVSRSEDGNLTEYEKITMNDTDIERIITFLCGENDIND